MQSLHQLSYEPAIKMLFQLLCKAAGRVSGDSHTRRDTYHASIMHCFSLVTSLFSRRRNNSRYLLCL